MSFKKNLSFKKRQLEIYYQMIFLEKIKNMIVEKIEKVFIICTK